LGMQVFTSVSPKIFLKSLSPSLYLWPKITHSFFLTSVLRLFIGSKRLSLPTLLFNCPIGVLPSKLCVMLVIMRLGRFWDNKDTRSLMSYPILARCSMRPNKTTQPPRSYSQSYMQLRNFMGLPLVLQSDHLYRTLHAQTSSR